MVMACKVRVNNGHRPVILLGVTKGSIRQKCVLQLNNKRKENDGRNVVKLLSLSYEKENQYVCLLSR